MIESLYILIITAAACSVLGVFLVLRGLSMVSDAISHSVLLGIVLAFFVVRDIDSVWLLIGAAVFGVLTTLTIELLIKSRRVSEDSAVGLVFPLFFSIAVILITKYARNVHLDTEIVLTGEVILAPFNRVDFFGFSLPRAMVQMGIVFCINILFILLSFNRMKLSTFDPVFATVAGVSSILLYYLFMGLVSLTAVAAFESVGAILTISFFIAPAASAYLVTKDLKSTIALAIVYAIINSCLGYVFAVKHNFSMSGMCAAVSGLTFFVTVLFCRGGLISKAVERIKSRHRFNAELLLLHIGTHKGDENMLGELGFESIRKHINWSEAKLKYHIHALIEKGYVYKASRQGVYLLTESGNHLRLRIKQQYGLLMGEEEMAKIDTSRDDYISAIYQCMEAQGHATNKQLSDKLGIKAASVSEMVKKLAEAEDVYLENKLIYLTPSGMKRAKQILTKHRLWEIFLVKYLGYNWQNVHEDAKTLEHVTSERLKNRLNDFLEKPMHCPHGNEIFENHPKVDQVRNLSALKPGESGIIHKVFDDHKLLEYMEEKGLALDDRLIVMEIDSFDNSVLVEKEGEKIYIAGRAADKMMMLL